MAEHPCKHEGTLAVAIDNIEDIKGDISLILEAIVGNGKVGLKTQTELNKAAIKRLYWIFGTPVCMTGLGVLIKYIIS